MNLYKLYDSNNNAVFFENILDLAKYCGVSRKDASKAFWTGVCTLNGHKVITYKK